MIIAASKEGQLANRLIHSSHLLAFALEHDIKIIYPYFDEFHHYFSEALDSQNIEYCHNSQLKKSTFNIINLLSKILWRFPFHNFLILELIYHYDLFTVYPLGSDSFIKKAKSKILILKGWAFRNETLFRKHSKKIRNHYRLNNNYQSQVNSFLHIPKQYEILIGIHMRGGDYKNFLNGKYYYSIEEYKAFTSYLSELLTNKNVGFLICSNFNYDDITTGFENFDNVFISQNEAIIDLYSLAECDLIIGPPSTFSLWASYTGNTPLVHIKSPENYKTELKAKLEEMKMIPAP